MRSAIAAFLVLLASSVFAQEKRVTLIIGNDAYTGLPKLNNAVADARAMDKKLKELGFQTTLRTNVGLQPGQVFRDCPDCPEMVVIPAGSFVMGAAPGEEERERVPNQFRGRSAPQHSVNVRSFMLGKYEVTVGEFALFANETGHRTDGGCYVWNGSKWDIDQSINWRNPGFGQGDRHPVACVNWNDAKAYTAWLSRKTDKGYRLATEAEWEYAARAGTSTARYWGNDGNQGCGYANVADRTAKGQVSGASNWPTANCDDGHAYTAPVGSFRTNAFGLHDMIGNVYEWTEDCWNDNYNGAPTDGSSWQTGDCQIRVLRGGSWRIDPRNARSANRGRVNSDDRVDGNGFRVARTN
jgi:formylglycine-generating enzyme required for sulfatase activity